MPGTDTSAYAATCVSRLAVQGPVACQLVVSARVVDELVAMLTLRGHERCRQAAAGGLTFLGWNCVRSKQEIIVRLCQEVKRDTNIVVLALSL